MYETVTLQYCTTTQCLLDWSSIEDHYNIKKQRILYQVLLCIICVECTERAMKEKNNDRIERRHAEEREEIYMLHTFIDYLAFLHTPPLCEVGTQVNRFRVPDTRFAGIQARRF